MVVFLNNPTHSLLTAEIALRDQGLAAATRVNVLAKHLKLQWLNGVTQHRLYAHNSHLKKLQYLLDSIFLESKCRLTELRYSTCRLCNCRPRLFCGQRRQTIRCSKDAREFFL